MRKNIQVGTNEIEPVGRLEKYSGHSLKKE
jgi:hypothetical protein